MTKEQILIELGLAEARMHDLRDCLNVIIGAIRAQKESSEDIKIELEMERALKECWQHKYEELRARQVCSTCGQAENSVCSNPFHLPPGFRDGVRALKEPSREEIARVLTDAAVALNQCIGIFSEQASEGRYPERLLGKGWKSHAEARDGAQSLARRLVSDDEAQL